MGETWDKINKIFGESGFLTEPAVLEATIFGKSGELQDRQVINALLSLQVAQNSAIETLAKDVDDLRARIDT